jgi:hypothetical protein
MSVSRYIHSCCYTLVLETSATDDFVLSWERLTSHRAECPGHEAVGYPNASCATTTPSARIKAIASAAARPPALVWGVAAQ